MGKLAKQNGNSPTLPKREPDHTETWAGKHTARVTHVYNQPDGSTVRATKKINKDGSITDKLERRYK